MNIIKFPGRGGGGSGDRPDIERAARLKQRLIEFVTKGWLGDVLGAEMIRNRVDPSNQIEAIDFTDWFIFNWVDEESESVADYFVEAHEDLEIEDLQILEGWYDWIDDVFEIVAIHGDGFELVDQDGDRYLVYPTMGLPDNANWQVGTHLNTRILPVGDAYVFSGIQSALPPGVSIDLFKHTRRAYEFDDVEGLYGFMEDDLEDELLDDADWLADEDLSFTLFYDAFVEHFGDDVVHGIAADLKPKIEAFYTFFFDEWLPERIDEDELEVEVESFQHALQPLVATTEVFMHPNVADRELGIVISPFDGLAVVPEFGPLDTYLRTGEGDDERMKQLLSYMLQSEEVPRFAIEWLSARYGPGFERLMAETVDDPEFDLERDLEDLLDEFKPEEEVSDPYDEVVDEFTLEDVREPDFTLAPSSSVTAAARDFLETHAKTLKPKTLEKHALGLNLLAHFARVADQDVLELLDAETLVEFLGEWYPTCWAHRSPDEVKQILSTLGKFTTWLDRTGRATIASEYKREVLPAVEKDLPRTLAATMAIDEIVRKRIEDLMEDETPESPLGAEAIVMRYVAQNADRMRNGTYQVATVGKDHVTVVPIAEDGILADEEVEETLRIDLPAKTAKLLQPGDLLEGSLLPEAEDRFSILMLLAIRPASIGE